MTNAETGGRAEINYQRSVRVPIAVDKKTSSRCSGKGAGESMRLVVGCNNCGWNKGATTLGLK